MKKQGTTGKRVVRRSGRALVGLAVACGIQAGAAAGREADGQRVFHRLGPVAVLGDGPHYVDVGLGVFDVFEGVVFTDDEENRSAAGRVELRLGEKLYFIGPAVGLMANTDGGVFGYVGMYADLTYGDIVITPFAGPGGYAEGGSKDLGGVFQFRTGVTVAYAFAGGSRLGIHLGHLSHAGINGSNPGEEDVFITYALPF